MRPLDDDEFLDFHVPYYEVRHEHVEQFKKLLDECPPERKIQEFLESNQKIIAAYIGVHPVYVIPQVKFSTHYVADFALAELNSAGPQWTLVELEPVDVSPFNQKGRPSAKLVHAIEQVKEWRRFVQDNQDHCRRPRKEHGLGLQGITSRFWGTVVMGRRSNYANEVEGWRNQHTADLQIEVISYDRLVERSTAMAMQNEWRYKSAEKS